MKLKFKAVVDENPPRGRTLKHFYCNGILIATHETGLEFYCTVKCGIPSRVRDRSKKTNWFHWSDQGLKQILGEKYHRSDFKVDGPDLKWGYAGDFMNLKQVRERITYLLELPTR